MVTEVFHYPGKGLEVTIFSLFRLEPPVRYMQCHGMTAGNHCEHDGIDERSKVDFSSL